MNDPIVAFQKKHAAHMAILAGFLVLLSVALGAGLFLLQKKVDSIRTARAERIGLMNDFEAITLLSHDKKMADLVLPVLEDSLPLELDVPTVVLPRFRALAAAHGVSATVTLGQRVDTGTGDYSSIAFSVRADGAVANLIDYLSAIESGKATVSVSSWSISGQGGKSELLLSGVIYVRHS